MAEKRAVCVRIFLKSGLWKDRPDLGDGCQEGRAWPKEKTRLFLTKLLGLTGDKLAGVEDRMKVANRKATESRKTTAWVFTALVLNIVEM